MLLQPGLGATSEGIADCMRPIHVLLAGVNFIGVLRTGQSLVLQSYTGHRA